MQAEQHITKMLHTSAGACEDLKTRRICTRNCLIVPNATDGRWVAEAINIVSLPKDPATLNRESFWTTQ